MKVLAGPRVALDDDGAAARVCEWLGGEGGTVVSLAALGLRNPYRGWSAAEVDALRRALQGQTGVVAYVCRGASVEPAGDPAGRHRLVAVTDHVNLTWRSPLAGPNDDRIGPRFPGMDGIYAPDEVASRAGPPGDIMVLRGVVAGVADDRARDAGAQAAARQAGWPAWSCELVAPAIIAAHMGLRVAAAVLI